MLGIIECISTDHLPLNLPNDLRLECPDHPGIGLCRRDWIRCFEPDYAGCRKTVLGVVARMTKYKYQLHACYCHLLEICCYELSADTLRLKVRMDGKRRQDCC